MKTVYIEKIFWYGDFSSPHYLNLKNAEIYGLDEALAKFGFKTQEEIEESSDFVRLFYVDYNELVRDFIRLYNDDDLTEASKKWTDEETFDDNFRWYIDGYSPIEDGKKKYVSIYRYLSDLPVSTVLTDAIKYSIIAPY